MKGFVKKVADQLVKVNATKVLETFAATVKPAKIDLNITLNTSVKVNSAVQVKQ